MNYLDVIKIFHSQKKFNVRLELSRVQKILKLLKQPQNSLKFVHVAGTNAKGSVCSILSSILQNADYKVGLFTSPHLVDYTERIRINNSQINKRTFCSLFQKIEQLAGKNDINLTEFEILTVIAFKYFFDNKVDIIILETGLGGRFDATNVIKSPICSVITSISKDHCERLGKTIEKIAFEKAGIIKQNSNVIVSAKNKGFKIINKIAYQKNAKVFLSEENIELSYKNETNFAIIDKKCYHFGLLGNFQKENLALALKAIDVLTQNGFFISNGALKKGLKSVSWKARFEFLPKLNVLIDSCHNPDGAKVLRESLDLYFKTKKLKFVYGTLKNKDYKNVMGNLFKAQNEVYFYNFNHPNSLKFPGSISKKQIQKMVMNVNKDELLVICGSIYMIGELLRYIKILN